MRPVVRRGDLRYLILHVLKDKSMHGYKIIEVLGETFGGLYSPSTGVVYPTLQMLEEMGYIESTQEDGKKIYSVTAEGLKLLEEKNERLKEVLERRDRYLKTGARHAHILRDYRRTVSLIIQNYEDLTPEEVEEIVKVIEEARGKIMAIISR